MPRLRSIVAAALAGPAPRALAGLWVALALLLFAWHHLAAPPPPELRPDATGAVALGATPGRILSLWVWWDAPRGHDGWLQLEHVGARSPAVEAYWRRRVHPGWNLLTWTDVPSPAAPDRLGVRLVAGTPRSWALAPPTGANHYGLDHLGRFSGLFVALGLLALALVWRAAAALARPAWPGSWPAAVALVTALALALRLRGLDAPSLWLDEVLTAIGAQDFTWVLYSRQVFGHPPLQYLVAWLVGGPAAGEFLFRLPFVLAGVVTVPLVGVLGRMLLGPMTGLVAAFVLAVSPFHVELSQTARPYAFLLLCTAASLVALVEAVRRDRLPGWVLFAAVATLLGYTHYLGLTVLGLEALATLILLGWRHRARLATAVLAFAIVALLTTPWGPVLFRMGGAQVSRGDLPAAVLGDLVLRAWIPQFLGGPTAATVALTLIGVGAFTLRRRVRLLIAATLWIALPLVALWVAQPAHFVSGRHLAFTFPAVVLLMAHGITAIARRVAALTAGGPLASPRGARGVAAVIALGLVLAWSLPTASALRGYYGWREGHDWRSVAAILDDAVAGDDEILATVAAAYPLRYYWRESVTVLDAGTSLGPLTAPTRKRRWVVTAPGGPWPPDLVAWLDAHAVRVAEIPASWSLPGVAVFRVRGAH